MNPHDIAETPRTYDDGVRVVCRCGKTFDGPDARAQHRRHFHIETSRAALKGDAD